MPSLFEGIYDDLVRQRESVQSVYEPEQGSYQKNVTASLVPVNRSCLDSVSSVDEAVTRTVLDPVFQTVYNICIRSNELPVIGTFIDEKITPGFCYRVRRVATNDYLWNGEARCLLSIGMGYGKRITFKGDDILNSIDFYFYSDTEPEGFAFIPAVPEARRRFVMCDEDNREVAEALITSFNADQFQLLSDDIQSKDIQRQIACSFVCDIHVLSMANGIRPLQSSLSNCPLQGIANIAKKGKQHSELISIVDVHLPLLGKFTFIPM